MPSYGTAHESNRTMCDTAIRSTGTPRATVTVRITDVPKAVKAACAPAVRVVTEAQRSFLAGAPHPIMSRPRNPVPNDPARRPDPCQASGGNAGGPPPTRRSAPHSNQHSDQHSDPRSETARPLSGHPRAGGDLPHLPPGPGGKVPPGPGTEWRDVQDALDRRHWRGIRPDIDDDTPPDIFAAVLSTLADDSAAATDPATRRAILIETAAEALAAVRALDRATARATKELDRATLRAAREADARAKQEEAARETGRG